MDHNAKEAFVHAIENVAPALTGIAFIGLSYGLFAVSQGFAPIYPILMSLLIFAGSMEFIAVSLLLLPFDPIGTFLLTIMVNARHVFYGISMLEKYKNMGWKKTFLIFGMCDESFALNYTARLPNHIDRGWYYLWVNWSFEFFWMFSTAIGALAGNYFSNLPTKGIEFILASMFIVIFLDLVTIGKAIKSGIMGIIISSGCLAVFGAKGFIVPSMLGILLVFLATYRLDKRKGGESHD